MNLTEVRTEVMAYIESLEVPGECYGSYRVRPEKAPGIYSTTDIAILRTIIGEDLKTSLNPRQRQEWIDFINTFTGEDGIYKGGLHSQQHSHMHCNGMVVGALGVLGGKQVYPVRFYQEFNTIDKVGPWLEEQIDWRAQWGASHLLWGGMLCYSMSADCTDAWRKTMFEWLDENLDPQTGWWRQGVEPLDNNHPLGGGSHIWPVYQHHRRPFPYPKEVIDSILTLQKEDGSWLGFANYLDLDALYGLAYMRSLAPDHRREDIREAVRNHGDLALRKYREFMDSEPDTHVLLAMVGELGLLQQLDPERFRDTVQWTDIFSDIRLYDTKAVERLEP